MTTACEDKYAAIQVMLTEARHEDALAALQQLVIENDDNAAAHNDLGSLYYGAGQMDQALAHYQKAAELNPEHPGYLKNLADILYSQTDDAERAVAIYNKILSIRPDDVDTLMVVGHLEVSLERFDEALGRYTRILALEPSHAEAKQFVDRIRRRKATQKTELSPETVYAHCQELVTQGQLTMALPA